MFASAVTCGMDYEMISEMTPGNLVDYIVSWNELHDVGDKKKDMVPRVRMATQADFDNF